MKNALLAGLQEWSLNTSGLKDRFGCTVDLLPSVLRELAQIFTLKPCLHLLLVHFQENTQLEDRLRQAQNRMSALAEEHEETHERLMQEKDAIEKERRANGELLDELSKELEELRLYKVEQEARKAGAGGQTVNDVPRSQRRQMESHIMQLRQVMHHSLKFKVLLIV